MPLTLTQSGAVLSKGQEKFAYRRLPEAMTNAECRIRTEALPRAVRQRRIAANSETR